MIKKFFKDKSILVTGASGSIGSEIVLKLLSTNCKVVRALSNDENGIYQLMSYIDNNHKLYFKEIRLDILLGYYGQMTILLKILI